MEYCHLLSFVFGLERVVTIVRSNCKDSFVLVGFLFVCFKQSECRDTKDF